MSGRSMGLSRREAGREAGAGREAKTSRGTAATRGTDPRRATEAEARREAEGKGRAQGLETGWTIMSYLLGGMLAYGVIGWLIGRAVHVSMIFPIGMLAGLVISLVYIVFRFGKQQAPSSKPQAASPKPTRASSEPAPGKQRALPRQAGSGPTASPKGDDR